MEKRTLWVLLIILAIILVVIISSIFILYKDYKNEKIIERNQVIYIFIKCISECPLVFNETYNMNLLEPSCEKECNQKNDYILPLGWEEKTVYHSEEFTSCAEEFLNSESFEELQRCYKEILPKLVEKYPYLE